MNTILISISHNQSSVSKYFLALSQELVQRGYQVVLLVSNQKYYLVDRNSNPIILTWPSKRPVYVRDAVFLHRVIQQYRPHCVIGNFASGNICAFVSWLNRVPHRWDWYHTMSRAIDMENLLSNWKIEFFRLRKKLVYRFNTQIISVSESAAKDLRKIFNITNEKSAVVLHCLLDSFSAEQVNTRSRVIVCVGRLIKFKGQETLLRAAEIILKTQCDVQFEFVGDGADRKYFEDLAVSLGVSEHCTFVGNVPRDDVLRKMASAMIFVLPSLADAFPLVIIEALSMGTPIIASDIDGIREQIIDGKVGLLFPPGNSKTLAQKILDVLENSELRERFHIAAREHFLQNFSYDALPRQVDELERILSG